MGRLEDIIARNRGQRLRPEASQLSSDKKGKMIASLFIGVVILLILALAVFTDLGRPPDAKPSAAPPPSADHHGPAADHHVNDIKIWRQPAKR